MSAIKTTSSAAAIDEFDPSTIGKKAAAMAYFSSVGLFDERLTIIGPTNTASAIERVRTLTVGPKGVTLRFSHGEELGLPRLFVRTREALVDSLHRVHDPAWTTIVHPYIDVRRSFEVNIEPDRWLLEHVPGMWESENTLLPDMLRSDSSRWVDAYIFAFERSGRVASTNGTWSVIESAPLRVTHVQHWARRLLPILATLRRDLHGRLPINVHFVEDGDAKWHFLNIRVGFKDDNSLPPASLEPLYSVASLEDLARWNGLRPILLRVTTSRGDESSLCALALAIKKRTSTVYVDFGVLSHPAIVMREFGLRVVPTSRVSATLGRSRFEHNRFFC